MYFELRIMYSKLSPMSSLRVQKKSYLPLNSPTVLTNGYTSLYNPLTFAKNFHIYDFSILQPPYEASGMTVHK